MRQQLLEAPHREVVRVHCAVIGDAAQGLVLSPLRIEEGRIVVHRLGMIAEPLHQHARVACGAADVHEDGVFGEAAEHTIVVVGRIHHLAQAPPGIAHEVRVAVDVLGTVDELRDVEQSADFRLAVLRLPPAVLVEGNAPLRLVPRFAEVGRERAQILE